jgi:hypothetical protein
MIGGYIFGTNAALLNLLNLSRPTNPRFTVWIGTAQTPNLLFLVLSIRESTFGIILQRNLYSTPLKLAFQYGELATLPLGTVFWPYPRTNQVIFIYTTLVSIQNQS